ncbi:MAG: response regulator [Dissulfurispiraceae bacterium]
MTQNQKKQILIVAREQGMRESLTGILEDEGFNVVTTSSGEEALGMLKQSLPDLVLLERKLPAIDGVAILKEIKEIKAGLPVIMLIQGGTEEEIKDEGAFSYLEIPISLEKLLLTVKEAFDKTYNL